MQKAALMPCLVRSRPSTLACNQSTNALGIIVARLCLGRMDRKEIRLHHHPARFTGKTGSSGDRRCSRKPLRRNERMNERGDEWDPGTARIHRISSDDVTSYITINKEKRDEKQKVTSSGKNQANAFVS
ncbi:hypothetical protein KIN20_031975 [Parelaphostrongylus tenuis]|uniref:Uncharacterized protein n=1 Tax=Parelaphostrongylus tenuis TaxID=148309 RepID=A0AAD5WHD9_PARTN|nr:hypothetical protein KIN20_031975 [Parelaphostrongylus tenuis]